MAPTLYVVEIQSWDWPLHVGVRPRLAAPDVESKRDLLCVQTVEIHGRIVTPQEHESKAIQLGVSPLPRGVVLGEDGEGEVGRLHRNPRGPRDVAFYARLLLPEDSLQGVLLCLSSKWRSVHIWVDDAMEPGLVMDFAFSSNSAEDPAFDEKPT
jgi:hypothetical protein